MKPIHILLMAGGGVPSGPIEGVFGASSLGGAFTVVSEDVIVIGDSTAIDFSITADVSHTATGTVGGVGVEVKVERLVDSVWTQVGVTQTGNSVEYYDSETGVYIAESGQISYGFTDAALSGEQKYRVLARKSSGSKNAHVSGSIMLIP